ANHRFFITVDKRTWLQESTPKLPPNLKNSSSIADGLRGERSLRWRNSASHGPIPCKANVRRAAKPTMISSQHGKTRTPTSRYSVKQERSTKDSLPLRRSPR